MTEEELIVVEQEEASFFTDYNWLGLVNSGSM